ncbi:regulator [Pseudonocardia sp. EC080610-09]|nr:regulator [Pseudonocardia sp. EC080610-09]ALL83392.1 regulator [Pseudonocardia sp. EC080619-01]
MSVRMDQMHPTSPASIDALAWRKSVRSGYQGNCVELAVAGTGVAVRNSRDPHGTVLGFSAAGMAGFLASIKSGELDDLA